MSKSSGRADNLGVVSQLAKAWRRPFGYTLGGHTGGVAPFSMANRAAP
jgi:hypothetical protein